MASAQPRPELLAIVGPTASGKSALALSVAKEFNGEIIAGDSRTVYRGMDIGTAKPSAKEQTEVPHWGLDLVNPGERYTAAQFKAYAEDRIEDISNRGKLPIIVGGTGLYVDSLLYQYDFPADREPQERQKLEKLTTEQLQEEIKHMGFKMPHNATNRRHLVRALERKGRTGTQQPLRQGVLLVGLRPSDEELQTKISRRAEAMFEQGVDLETQALINLHGEEALLETGGIVYKICLKLIKNEITKDEAVSLFKTADWQYARRQRTWFKRNPDIHWFNDAQKAELYFSKLSRMLK